MKAIKDVSFSSLSRVSLILHHENGYLRIYNNQNTDYKGLKIYKNKKDYQEIRSYQQYTAFSKEDLKEIQLIMLNAYVFVNDKLDEAVANSESKEKLDEIRTRIKVLRKHLRYITNYIDSYDEMLEDYKEV
jgi:phosphomevalonate kinase